MCYTVHGRLGKDAEIFQSKSGNSFVRFSFCEDRFRGGQRVPIWYDVLSYDPFVINTQIKALKKGTFAVITGRLDVENSVGQNGKLYLNQKITAWNINIPSVGAPKSDAENGTSQAVSTSLMSLDGLASNQQSADANQSTLVMNGQTPDLSSISDNTDDLPF